MKKEIIISIIVITMVIIGNIVTQNNTKKTVAKLNEKLANLKNSLIDVIDDNKKKWVFVKIEENTFHWQNITIKEDGEWHINADIYAERIK